MDNGVSFRNSIEREEESDSCYNNITSSWEIYFFKFASFILRSRFQEDNNLKLSYLLLHAQTISLAEASIILKISRTLFYTKILPENPAFNSRKVSVSGWGQGGQERRIKLSKDAKEFSTLIEKLSQYHLGENECRRLRIEASKIRKKVVKIEEKYHKRIKNLHEHRHSSDFMKFVYACTKDFKKSKEEILVDVENMRRQMK